MDRVGVAYGDLTDLELARLRSCKYLAVIRFRRLPSSWFNNRDIARLEAQILSIQREQMRRALEGVAY